MALKNVKVEAYGLNGNVDTDHDIVVNEFGGRMILLVREEDKTIRLEVYKDDIDRAWNAVKRH